MDTLARKGLFSVTSEEISTVGLIFSLVWLFVPHAELGQLDDPSRYGGICCVCLGGGVGLMGTAGLGGSAGFPTVP